jgi:c-di-GMP-binding flagellar brake protein YcgR
MTLVLPMRIQREDDATEGALTEKSVNISGGGIGFVADTDHNPGDIVAITLRLDEETLLKVRAEVLRRNPLPRRADAYRIHARFIHMSDRQREMLIGHIMRVQREHLHEHYSA